jgi:hypothetical protein
MSDPSNQSIETLLRRSFDGPVPDNGFSERVMQLLPARRVRVNPMVAAGIVAGIAACWIALTSTSLVRDAGHDWTSGKPSSSILIMLAAIAGMSLLASWWAMAEAE